MYGSVFRDEQLSRAQSNILQQCNPRSSANLPAISENKGLSVEYGRGSGSIGVGISTFMSSGGIFNAKNGNRGTTSMIV